MTVPAPVYTVDGLVDSVLNKYIIPLSQSTFTTQNIVDLLDEEMRSTIIPLVNSVREEYWVYNYDQDIVAGQSEYTIPQRCVAGMLRDVVFLDANGNQMAVSQLSPVQVKSGFPYGPPLPAYGFGYYMQDDKVVLYPPQQSAATAFTLRMKFLRRPNNLTLTSNCSQIVSIAGNALTLAVNPDWTVSTVFDIIQNYPQFRSAQDDAELTAVGASSITLEDASDDLAAGMWVCPTLMTCIPQLPYETFPLLVERGIIRMSEAIGESSMMQAAEKRYAELATNLVKMISPRVQGGSKTIINPNNRTRNVGIGWRGQ